MLEPVISNIKDWPIAKLARHQDEIIEDVSEESNKHLQQTSQHTGGIRDLIAKALYLERIRIKNEPWDVDPEDENEFWSNIKKKLSSYDPSLATKEEASKIENSLL